MHIGRIMGADLIPWPVEILKIVLLNLGSHLLLDRRRGVLIEGR